MKNVQDIFNKIKIAKKEQREIKSIYRDVLSNSEQYKQVLEKINKLKEEKKTIEETIKSDFKPEFTRFDELKGEIESDSEILNDLTFNNLVKGEMVKIVDEYNNEYEPIFSVKFKKI